MTVCYNEFSKTKYFILKRKKKHYHDWKHAKMWYVLFLIHLSLDHILFKSYNKEWYDADS